jgi:hypothetical protein
VRRGSVEQASACLVLTLVQLKHGVFWRTSIDKGRPAASEVKRKQAKQTAEKVERFVGRICG